MIKFDKILVWEQVYIHVYKLKDSDLGFYHTGIEIHGSEFTFCHEKEADTMINPNMGWLLDGGGFDRACTFYVVHQKSQ